MEINHFEHISILIKEAQNKAVQLVNKELISLYWNVGEYISKRLENSEWGDKSLDLLATYLKEKDPTLSGFNRRGLYRMSQFYNAYKDDNSVSPLVTQLSWTHHLIILSKTKLLAERQFYIQLAIKERLSKRELERQIKSGYFERSILANKLLPPSIEKYPQEISHIFKDSYVFEFLNIPEKHSEQSLQKALIQNLKAFILELGKDFIFIDEEFRLQVGMKDFYIDLLFYHRELCCLVAFELKIEDFEPAHLGQLNFYLEALDADIKKPHENPSIGVLICKNKDTEVVEYALRRNLSPTLIADYSTKLIDKNLLETKVHELFEIIENSLIDQNV